MGTGGEGRDIYSPHLMPFTPMQMGTGGEGRIYIPHLMSFTPLQIVTGGEGRDIYSSHHVITCFMPLPCFKIQRDPLVEPAHGIKYS
jgi:hypothetical protein